MEGKTGDIPLRWVALIVTLINIGFNYILNAFTDIPSIKELTFSYNTLFIPAGYAFSIWGLIYLAYIIYCIVQLIPSQHSKTGYDYLNIPFIIVNLLGIVWIYTFRQNLVTFSEVVIIGMLLCAIILFGISRRLVRRLQYNRWIVVPFSLLMGWLSIACIAGTAVFLVSIKWNGLGISPENWVMIILAVALLLSLLIGVGCIDMVYPLVIAWGTFAIWISLRKNFLLPAQVALGVAVMSLLISIWAMVKQSQHRKVMMRKEDSL